MYTRIINGIVIALFVAFVAIMTPGASAAGEPTVQVSEFQVNPPIMMPDSLGTITIVVKNTATSAQQKENSGLVASEFITSTVTDINVNIENVQLEGKGIKVISQDFENVGAIGPGQSIPLTFMIRAPAESGMYYPEVWIDTTGGKSTRYPIPVNVNTPVGIQKQAILIVESTLPESVNPGDEIPVTVTVKNTGETLADDVVLKIENVSMIAPKITDLYHIGTVGPTGEKSVEVILVSDKKADPGLIRVPVSLRYSWIDGSQYTNPTSIDIVLQGKAELGLVSVDTSPRRVPANQPFDLTMRIENTGTGEAKQVSATVDLPMTGTKQSFIGKIKQGNDAPAVFMLDSAKGGTYDYTATISYIDDLGTHTITKPMSLRVVPEDYTGAVILVLVVLAVAGFFGYRYWYLPRKNGHGALPWVKKN
ncbi:MAG: S-layer protein [Methanoregulaceae archaeon]|nr:S-layer protein [Methanoregulaceae archaeon]